MLQHTHAENKDNILSIRRSRKNLSFCIGLVMNQTVQSYICTFNDSLFHIKKLQNIAVTIVSPYVGLKSKTFLKKMPFQI